MIEEIPAKTLTNTTDHVEAWRAHQRTKPRQDRVYCYRWDSSRPQPLIDCLDGQCIGILQPVEWRQ